MIDALIGFGIGFIVGGYMAVLLFALIANSRDEE